MAGEPSRAPFREDLPSPLVPVILIRTGERTDLGDVGVVGQLDAVVADGAHDGEDERKLPHARVLVGQQELVVLPLLDGGRRGVR